MSDAAITIYGAPWDPDCRRVKRLLGEMRQDFAWVDVDMDDDSAAYVRRRNGGRLVMPFVVLESGAALAAPTGAELAEALELELPTERRFFDLLVVGAGPAGLTAALAAVREGLRCLVIDRAEPGGQAADTPYLFGTPGFAEGVGGDEVQAALRAQARRYGVRILAGAELTGLRRIDGYLVATTRAGAAPDASEAGIPGDGAAASATTTADGQAEGARAEAEDATPHAHHAHAKVHAKDADVAEAADAADDDAETIAHAEAEGTGAHAHAHAEDADAEAEDAEEEIIARAMVVATGVRYAELGVPGEYELRGAGVHSCASCEGPFYRKAEELLVVGGGDLAGQEALTLTQFAGKVRMLESSSHFPASPAMLDRLRQHPRIELYTATEVLELAIGGDGQLSAVLVRDRTTGYSFTFSPVAVFVYAGMRPNTEVFEGALELDEAGFILTDHRLQSSMPGVFVAGDVRTGSTKQLGSAIGDGSAVILMVRQYLEGLGDIATRASA